jgi:hypothetical protein
MSKVLCSDSCSDELGILAFNDCNPDWNEGGIEMWLLTNVGYPLLSSEGDYAAITAELIARMSNTSTNPNAIRFLTVKADKPAPTKNEIEMSKRRKIVTSKDHMLNIIIDETGQDNYDFLRKSECQGQYLQWYVGGKYMFGGEDAFVDGQEISISIDDIIPQSNKDLDTFVGTASWNAKFHPTRILNPLA